MMGLTSFCADFVGERFPGFSFVLVLFHSLLLGQRLGGSQLHTSCDGKNGVGCVKICTEITIFIKATKEPARYE